MCFTIAGHPDDKPRTAPKGGVRCWKVVIRLEYHPGETAYLAKYYAHQYVPGKTYKLGRQMEVKGPYRSIDEGFHSYSHLGYALMLTHRAGDTVLECLIPEGAEYYVNPENKEYVSDKITAIKEILP